MEPVTAAPPSAGGVGISVTLTPKNPIRWFISIHPSGPGEIVAVVITVENHAKCDLSHVALAYRTPGPFLGFREGGHEHAGKNGNDGDDHQQFDQRKSMRVANTPREAVV